MGNLVISPFITEEHIRLMNDLGVLKDFASCSKPVIVDNVIKYIFSADANEEVKSLLEEAYKEKLSFINAVADESVISNVDKVYGYEFGSVHAGLSIEELSDMRDSILSVYNDSYNVPYINAIDGDVIANVINTLLATYKVTKDIDTKRLALVLSKNKDLFRDRRNTSAKGTIFKNIVKRSQDLDIILAGIDFLITQKSKGVQPEAWRIF